jgi:signal transduction histidine kinase
MSNNITGPEGQREAEMLVLEIDIRGTDRVARIHHERGGIVGVGVAGMSERMDQVGRSFEITSGDQGATARARLRPVKVAG